MNPSTTSRRRITSGTGRRDRDLNLVTSGLRRRPTSALAGSTNKGIPLPLASNSKYMKEVGFVEFLKSTYEQSKKNKKHTTATKASTAHDKDVDDYREEVVVMKRKVQELNTENKVLRMRVRKGQEDLARRQRAIDAFLRDPSRPPSSCLFSRGTLDQDASINNLHIKLFKVHQTSNHPTIRLIE